MFGALILAMVLSGMIVHGAEQAKRRSVDAWRDMRSRAEQRGAARERARQQRTEEFERKLNDAHRQGPSAPLWWAWAAGYGIAGAAAALGAGMVGAATGAVEGARSGYAIGQEGGRKGWKFAEAWRQWRKQARREIALKQCERCGGWTHADNLTTDEQYGRVCEDCVPRPTGERDEPPQDEPVAESPGCDGTCTNSDMDFEDAERQGLCPWCAGRREYVSNFGGRHFHTPCDECHGTGKHTPKTEAADEETPQTIHVHAEREDGNTSLKEITNTMTALPSAHSAELIATSEGYTDTVQDLQSLTKLLGAVQEKVQGMNESLTSESLDVDTLNQLSDLTDSIETATSQAEALHRHVESRHQPVAGAVAEAGGSQNVANKAWYDNY